MLRESPRRIYPENTLDIEKSDGQKIAFNLVISLFSLASILLLVFTGQTVLLWNWSFSLLFVFFLPGYAIWSIFEKETQDQRPIWLLRNVGLSILLAIFVTFVLGLFHAIQVLNVILCIALLTFIANTIYFWRNRKQFLIYLKNFGVRLWFMDLRSGARITRLGWLLVLIFFLNVVFRTWLAVSNGIWRDGPFHAMVAQQIVKSEGLVSFSPFNVVEVTEGERSYWPVTYPLAYHLLLAIMYMLGGEMGILFLSPLISSLSILGVYIIAKNHFGIKIGVLTAGFFSTDVVTAFVSVSVYMDTLIFFFTILTVIEFENLLGSNRRFSPVWTGLWLGMLASIKQTGILTAFSVVAYGFVLVFYELKLKRETRKLKQVLTAITIASGMAFPFLLYQFTTFGSLLYPPFTFPLMKEKWTINSESAAYLQRFQLEYNKPIYDILYETLLYPFPLTIGGGITSAVLGGLALLGLFYSIKNKRKTYLTEFFVLSSVALGFVVLFRLVIPRYFLFLRVFSAIFVIQGIHQMQEFLAMSNITRWMKNNLSMGSRRKKAMSYLFLFFVCFSLIYLIIMDISIANASDRIGNRVIQGRIDAYQQAGLWVQQNTPLNVLILGGRAHEVAYYTQRDTLWIFWFGAHNVPKIFHARTAQEALTYLATYKIDYIWLDRLQVANGFYELIPLHGLTDIIGFSPFFEKVFENNITRIFRVNYFPKSPFLARIHYYGASLGGPLDFDTYQIIKLNDIRSWATNKDGIGRNLESGSIGFIEVQVDPTEFDLINGNISSIHSSITFYYRDTFEGTIQISVLNSEGQYSKLMEITGKNSGLIHKITAIHTGVYLSRIWRKEIYGEEIISGSIVYKVQNGHNSAFPLLGVLLIPGEVDFGSIPDMVEDVIPRGRSESFHSQ
ncbi:MAG: glycosyltransferase family 39 protein [Candidatus Hodarchaeota archaeon]